MALYISASDGGDRLVVRDIPVHALTRGGKAKREVDVQALVDTVSVWSERRPTVIIENSTPMPGQGSASTFSFGKTFGLIYGVCAANKLVIVKVAAAKWKRDLAVPKDKDGARARASVLLPKHSANWPLKKHDGRAEAALLALYGSMTDSRYPRADEQAA
jgi:crossover junction endodeoxyribonuclease RuvC